MGRVERDNDRDRKLSHKFAQMYLRQDGVFVLKLVAKNSTDLVVADILSALWDNYKNKPIFGGSRSDDLDNFDATWPEINLWNYESLDTFIWIWMASFWARVTWELVFGRYIRFILLLVLDCSIIFQSKCNISSVLIDHPRSRIHVKVFCMKLTQIDRLRTAYSLLGFKRLVIDWLWYKSFFLRLQPVCMLVLYCRLYY